ncbi:heparinase II/III domain-containing protein [Mycolicibacterium pulveris]|uniref:heparinase II/III family protein n=1 Tax=Mycolicibacterium pulveris TaxID=36813 RepID=UPI003CF6CF3E
MAVYRVKRNLRDRVARWFPNIYAKHIEQVTSSIPHLDRKRCSSDNALSALAETIAPFYYDEYVDNIDSVVKGCFHILNRTVDFGSVDAIDWHHRLEEESDFHLWRQKLAHMGFVSPLLISGGESRYEAVSALIKSFCRSANFGVPDCFSSFWFPYSVSHRILAVLSGYIVALQSQHLPKSLCADIEEFLRWNVGFLLANVEHDLRNNHVERNLAALCLYFSCIENQGYMRRRLLNREVRRILTAYILADGFGAERSAMYQGLSVLCLGIFEKAGCLSPDTRALARRLHQKATRAWRFMTHPDGEIALFNDSWIGEVPPADRVTGDHSFASVELLPQAGYARLAAGPTFALMDAGPIGPRWCPGHGHADFLSVEIDIDAKRFIVDPGTYQYSTGPRRSFERSAASHNGPTRSGLEPVEYTDCFRVGRMNDAKFVKNVASAAGGIVRGQLTLRDRSVIERTVELYSETLRVIDEWFEDDSGAFVRLTISDSWVPSRLNANTLEFRAGESIAQMSVLQGRVETLGCSEWSSHYLESRPASTVILTPVTHEGRTRLVWEVIPIA